MNRMEEYQLLMQELEHPVPGLEHTLDRARRKRIRRKRIIQPLVAMAATLLIFVGLVNLSKPMATLCSKIPFLAELAEAVTFSDSLSHAVANDYIQPISISGVDGDVTATVEYLIVDQKQVNVFFRLFSDAYPNIKAIPHALSADGDKVTYSCTPKEWMVPNGGLQCVSINFFEDDVPDSLHLQLDILDMDHTTSAAVLNALGFGESEENVSYVAHFEFPLEFETEYIETGAKRYSIDRTYTINNQTITITDLEIYPTHMRLNVCDDPDNTAWLENLTFYIATETEKIDTALHSPGTYSVRYDQSDDHCNYMSFFAESIYFNEPEHFDLVIKEAEWTNKEPEELIVNLKKGEAEQLADQITVYALSREPNGWLIEFLLNSLHSYESLAASFYDEDGVEYPMSSWEHKNIGYKTSHFFEITPPEGKAFEKMSLSIRHRYKKPLDKPISIRIK